MRFSTDYYNHRGALVVLLLLTAVVLEVLRRAFRRPLIGDLRGTFVMGGCALAIAAALMLGYAFVAHIWPFGP